MARGRYSRTEVLPGNVYGSFDLPQTNRIKQVDTFDGVISREYIVKSGERLDHLAARFLNDDRYWWTIALLNDLIDPFLEPGQKIRIPLDVNDVLDRM
jgi:nucleoid-associated protein YgaU